MFRILLISLVLVGCTHDNDDLKGDWTLSCYYTSSVISQFSGIYSFRDGII